MGNCKVKVSLRGNIPTVLDPADPRQMSEACWWDAASQGFPPALGQRGCSHRTATHQPLHSPPRMGCTRMFKLHGPNPAPVCLNCMVQTLLCIPPLSYQSLQGNCLTTAQHNPLRGRGPPEALLRKVQSCYLWVAHYYGLV